MRNLVISIRLATALLAKLRPAPRSRIGRTIGEVRPISSAVSPNIKPHDLRRHLRGRQPHSESHPRCRAGSVNLTQNARLADVVRRRAPEVPLGEASNRAMPVAW